MRWKKITDENGIWLFYVLSKMVFMYQPSRPSRPSHVHQRRGQKVSRIDRNRVWRAPRRSALISIVFPKVRANHSSTHSPFANRKPFHYIRTVHRGRRSSGNGIGIATTDRSRCRNSRRTHGLRIQIFLHIIIFIYIWWKVRIASERAPGPI